jgi:hypothetical protein
MMKPSQHAHKATGIRSSREYSLGTRDLSNFKGEMRSVKCEGAGFHARRILTADGKGCRYIGNRTESRIRKKRRPTQDE